MTATDSCTHDTRTSQRHVARTGRQGQPDSEPPIDLDTMLDLTAAAERRRRQVRRRRSVPVRSARQHRLDRRRPEAAGRQDRVAKDLVVGSLVAPVWPPTGGGSAMGSDEERTDVRHAGAQGVRASRKTLRELGVRKYGVIRIDSAASPAEWAKDPAGNTKKIAETFRAGVRHRRRPRRAAGGRRRDLLGRHAQLEAQRRAARAGRPPEDARLPGRHGAHAALHAGLQRARGSHPARGLRLVGPRHARRGAARR